MNIGDCWLLIFLGLMATRTDPLEAIWDGSIEAGERTGIYKIGFAIASMGS